VLAALHPAWVVWLVLLLAALTTRLCALAVGFKALVKA
jgi:hypothetical protein